ncbi:MAG TPA: tRNA pseudouridine(55) synthase TruB [Candidatus Limnocylindrales bacterium]
MDGILVVEKPVGPTSHDVVALVRRLSGTKRVGHGGTLDPFASGVLPLFLGRATRMLEYHLGDGKAYRATVCFGAGSTTDDLEGELSPAGQAPERATVEAALGAFRGEIVQTPPAFSAIKVGGRRAYALARSGETPVLAPRTVTISRIDIVEWDGSDPERPIAVLEVECSAGTYVRAIARDLGVAAGSAAYLGGLVRTASGPFALPAARTLDGVREAAAEGRLASLLLPADAGLEELPSIRLTEAEIAEVARGRFVTPSDRPSAGGPEARYRLLDADGRLVAMGALRGGRVAPDKVFVDAPGASSGGPVDPVALSERDPAPSVDPDPASPDGA